MNIVYYSSGITGWGRIVIGISIWNAFKRRGLSCKYTIISSSEIIFKTDEINYIIVPPENQNSVLKENYHNSSIYKTLMELKPDIMLFDHIWFATYNFIHELSCKKIFLCHQVADSFFSIDLPEQKLVFNPDHFDKIVAIEPFKSIIEMDPINPIIFRNRDEILSIEDAFNKLKLDKDRPVCLFSFNAKTGNFNKYLKKYSYLEDIYQVIYAHKHEDHLFPEVDYFNAFDFIVCSGSYNQFWEAIYFDKEAIFNPLPLTFEDQQRRINECQEYYFDENGADQLVDIIMNL